MPDSPYHYAALTLVGPLIAGLDLATFHAGTVDLDHSSAYFFDSRDFGSSVLLTSFTFTTPSVPEPATGSLRLAALALGCARWLAGKTGFATPCARPRR